MSRSSQSTRNPALVAAVLVFFGMVAVIASVQGFEHIGGYIPCKLCLAQRQPYYYAFPVSLIAILSAWRGWSPVLTRGALLVTGALLLWTFGLGIYHSGVEWGWWQGPGDCGAVAGGISTNVGDLLGDLTAKRPPSCTEAAGRFLGLSFAGWNVLASAALALIAFRGALKK
ncbi:MAG: disulfide bond formation protein B [Nitratireductor sp.]|nr:disulfide bond formation protein B [Nitratireductor sp.]